MKRNSPQRGVEVGWAVVCDAKLALYPSAMSRALVEFNPPSAARIACLMVQ